MRTPLHLLVLLGFICQGYTFGSLLAPALYALVWYLCLLRRRPAAFLPAGVEEMITLLAMFAAYRFGADFGYNRLVFIGNAMVVFQAMYLLRPLQLREKMYSVAVAMIHLAVGSQVIVDYEFVLVLGATLVLVPSVLFNLEAERHHGTGLGVTRRPLNWPELACLVCFMAAFFVFCPRFRVMGATNPLTGGAGQRQEEQVDMVSGGGATDDRILFRIEGQNLTYLKQSALDTWDGRTWTASRAILTPRRQPRHGDITGTYRRTVRLISVQAMGNVLPVDGYVVRMDGEFYPRPVIAEHGGAMAMFGTHHSISYAYWTRISAPTETLSARDRARYLLIPAASQPLRTWLDGLLGRVKDPQQIAAKLARHFRENHAYQVGAPALDRFNPVDDFVLNRREGHCERFASALAVLLRMRGVPARVGLGWIAAERNAIGGFYTVRSRHGHAWTEAWIDGKGWVICDATPYGLEITRERRPLSLTVYEWVEYVWYAKIVEFSVSDQASVLGWLIETAQTGIAAAAQYGVMVVGTGLLLVLTVLVPRVWRRRRRRQDDPTRQRHREVQEARHFYGRLLRILAHQKLERRPGLTPLEFLVQIEAAGHPRLDDIRALTQDFCEVRYGEHALSDETRAHIEERLARLRRATRQ